MTNKLIIEIETAIRKTSWATVQPGKKSLQTITVDFDNREISSKYTTGITKFMGMELDSVRDNFKLTKGRFNSDGDASFSVIGETATGVRVLPNINYQFDFFKVSASTVSFCGNHDGYPSYNISVNGKSAYDFIQGFVWQLAGKSDINVLRKTFKVSK